MEEGMQGRAALVTGGGSGIGRASAVALANEGAKVVVTGRNARGLEETVSQVKAAGGEARAIAADLMSSSDIERMIAEGASAFGRLDYLVNNAGAQGEVNVLADQRLESFDEVFAVNVRALFLCMKFAIPHILAQGGAVVNLSSGGGLVGVPGASVYCASKHAVMGMTKVAALDYAQRGVRVNAVNPGGVDTPMLQRFFDSIEDEDERRQARAGFNATHPMGRIATVEEVAAAVTFLCSPKAAFVTGIALSVDGGYVAH